MRRLIAFQAEGVTLGGSIDGDEGTLGLLMVTGGSQTRIGSHRMYEGLAKSLARDGFCCFRFDRRGVGDSAGEDPGFRGSAADLAAAAAAFRRECPQLRRIVGFGLCDGATAIALFGAGAGIDGIVLANPWLVESGDEAPPPAAIKAHYWRRLTSRDGWRKLLSGAVDWRKMLTGVRKVASGSAPSPLAADAAAGIARLGRPAALILCTGDATAIAAAAELKDKAFGGRIGPVRRIDSDSHTFARPGDAEALHAAVRDALRSM